MCRTTPTRPQTHTHTQINTSLLPTYRVAASLSGAADAGNKDAPVLLPLTGEDNAIGCRGLYRRIDLGSRQERLDLGLLVSACSSTEHHYLWPRSL
jgi:hypothetical protein